ncbi:DUF1748-domain-containing protein [Phaeosphaeriaceae sp. SRC1lsM3a]|nr:DUF1748-domain-containing protein [Stagonospora sp. SRC1lsM3a]
MVLGRLTHYAFDAVLLSAFLAGVRRSTGLTYVSSYHTTLRTSNTKQTQPLPNAPPKPKKYISQTNTSADSPSVKPEQFAETPGVKKWIDNYLWVGETVMDQSVAFFAASSYFERKR